MLFGQVNECETPSFASRGVEDQTVMPPFDYRYRQQLFELNSHNSFQIRRRAQTTNKIVLLFVYISTLPL